MRPMETNARTLAEIVAPFGRLPAAAVALVADALLERMDALHGGGTVGLDLQPTSVRLGADGATLASASALPPWLLAPERHAGGMPSAKADLFALGALLLELLTGRRVLDAGSPEATAALAARLRQPPPVAAICPTVPGFLERLLLSLLHPEASRRAPDAASARAAIDAAVSALRASFPDALAAIVERTPEACSAMHQAQAAAEAERGQALVADPRTRTAAAVCLARSHALLPGQPAVESLLQHAAAAGLLRGGRPPAPELVEALTHIAQAEPDPPPALLRKAAALHQSAGDLLEALALAKRVLLAQPSNRILAAQLAELAPDAPGAPFAAGGESALAPITKGATSAAPGKPTGAPLGGPVLPVLDATDEPTPGPVGQLVRSLGQAYGRLEPRSRLFLMVLAFGALTGSGLLVAQRTASGPNRTAQLANLARAAADCQPGGRVVLIRAQQAARLGEVRLVEELIHEADEKVPMGTRCHEYGLHLIAGAQRAHQEAR